MLERVFDSRLLSRFSVSTRVWIFVSLMGLYSSLVVWIEHAMLDRDMKIPSDMHSLVAVVLGMLLVFRTNTAYDRWWEGRKLWGQLNNDCRSLAIKARSLVKTDLEDLQRFGHLIIQFARALKDHLRNQSPLAGSNPPVGGPTHLPIFVLSLIYEQIGHWRREGQIDGNDLIVLDKQASSFADVMGACERIRKTPLVYSYRQFVNQAVVLFLVTLPLGLVEKYKLWTIPAAMLVSYLLLGLEIIAISVEEPFGHERDDLPLDDICNGIESSVTEILTEGLPH